MEPKIIDIKEEPTDVEALLVLLGEHQQIILKAGDNWVARIESLSQGGQKRVPGLHAGTYKISDDFDAELSDAFWLGDA
ncbi:MAG: hypothetical protein H6670_01240 [Anaerolineaceae bacterium]|nr:hypothetical protein [Anaerolineaceae bacterium]